MSQYTTGEMAKLCGVTVRTVQYYDSRNILVPSQLSEGGRRLYSEQDLRRLKIICFLREAGISINSIRQLMEEEDPGSVISVLLQQQGELLRQEIGQRQAQLEALEGIGRERRRMENFSVESIGDIAYIMESRKQLRRVHTVMLATGIPLCAMEWGALLLWISTGIWWLFLAYFLAAIPYGIWVTAYYFKRTAYICPQCHQIFRPALRESFWARHTPTLRKLTCPCCGHKGFCVEIYQKEKDEHASN